MRHYDVVILGGGHNGLTAASYLAKAGKSVLVLERLDYLGGAATSSYTFDKVAAKLSRYSYLVSLLPQQIIDDLGLEISLAKRRYSSYTPTPDQNHGLLIDLHDRQVTAESFEKVASAKDFAAWNEFYSATELVAKSLFPTVLSPLKTRSEVRQLLGEGYETFLERPIGEVIAERFESDLVRGVVMTDALIGTFAPNIDPDMDANKCFLYHVIGGGTGDWNIPIGGMGQLSESLASAATRFGAELVTGAEVTRVSLDKEIEYRIGDEQQQVSADFVLANVSRTELHRLLGKHPPVPVIGAQVKVNMLLTRLPKLKDPSVLPEQAFGGTFHINETFSQLQAGYNAALGGELPDPLPCEIYCHSLTDPSILSPELQALGAQTLTVFALHTPHSLIGADNEGFRKRAEQAVINSLNSVLAEDIRGLIYQAPNGEPCIETKTTQDLEEALGLPGGNIFHEPLSWPFAEDDEELSTPAERWGVASGFEGILFCGSSARRGGAVSGIAGHNAAMAVLENG
jgi:phytoene dehydrogenase-like protein